MSYRNCVMIVDDNDEFAKALATKFEERGFEVVVLNNGDEAVKSYRKIMPDIVLMDKVMPTMSGSRATEEILKIDPDAVIVGITGFNDDDDEEFLNAGVKNVFKKPINIPNLLAEIEMHIDKVTVNILRQRIYNLERGLAQLSQEIVDTRCDIQETKIQMSYIAKNSENLVNTFKNELGKARNSGLLGGMGGSILVAIVSYLNQQLNSNSALVEWIVNNSVLVIIMASLFTMIVVFSPQIFGKMLGVDKEEEVFELPNYLWEVQNALITHNRKKQRKKKTKKRII